MATHNALAGKVAVVTGSGRGIGRGIAEQFAAAGASVLVATRGRDADEEVVGVITDAGNVATLHVVDLSSRQTAEGPSRPRSTPMAGWTYWSTTPASIRSR